MINMVNLRTDHWKFLCGSRNGWSL